MHHLLRLSTAIAVVAMFGSAAVAAEDPAAYYDSNCAACHTIGGGAQGGPDLKDVTSRRPHDWLVRFLLDPQHMVDAKDPLALQLVKDADGAVMPTFPDITPQVAEGLLRTIQQRSGQAATVAPDSRATADAFKPEDAQRGAELFAGTRRLANRGPACLSCHEVAGLARLGGGTFGPDLTRSHRRLGEGRGLRSWLGAPPTPMMRATFQPMPLTGDEVHALSAYLVQVESLGVESAPRSRIATLMALGTTGAVGCVVIAGIVGRRRFRAVRAPLVETARSTAEASGRVPLADRQPVAVATRESAHENR